MDGKIERKRKTKRKRETEKGIKVDRNKDREGERE